MEEINGYTKLVNQLVEQLDINPDKYCYNLGKRKSLDFPIFRFITIDSFLEILIKKNISLVRTSLWDDVYENFLLKQPMKNGHTLKEYIDGMYGQCWTKISETDALWRIYSPERKSVRIRTILKRLLTSILESKDYNPTSNFGFSAGIVSYHAKEYLNSFSNKMELHNLIGNVTGIMIGSLFLKRNEFKHENEVRIIFRETVSEDYFEAKEQITKDYTIEPNELIGEVTFDPRCSDRFYNTYSNVIKATGYSGEVNKSDLYSFD